ncbi:iron-containing redox enzyme family protein, partial [Methylomagnum sp.]
MGFQPPANPRQLCQTLLNGVPSQDDLRAAANLLDSALTTVGRACIPMPDDFGQPGMSGTSTCPTYELTLPKPESPAARRHILQALAPTLRLDGIWLARVAQPATGHLAAESQLFELYCRMMGLDDPARSPALRCRASLILAGVHLPDLDNPGFCRSGFSPTSPPGVTGYRAEARPTLALLHLCLMHRPRTFFPELLGYTLAHVHREPAWWDAPPPDGTDDPRAEFRALALAALDSYPPRESHAGRIRAGWDLYRHGWNSLLAELAAQPRPVTAEDAMAALIRAKLPQAIGYHSRVKLAGRGLDDWLRAGESTGDFRPLLQALRDSPRIDRACPVASRLIKAMAFGGAMFGVFDEAERRVCLAWIEEETASFPRSAWECSHGRSASRIGGRGDGENGASPASRNAERGNDGVSVRGLYTALLRAESPADFPPAADAFVERILRRARWLDRLRPWRRFAYSHAAFHDHIENLHRRAVARYRPLVGPPKASREFCRWAALQLSPAILVDGAWLAGIPTAAEKLGDIGRHLLKIYADELGNGQTDWNHPNVQRRLLDGLGYELPSFDSGEFAAHPGFVAAAFDIPVYLMAIGQRPDKYFPEILGLNLAIELSGLGAEYMKVVDVLNYYGIDSTIIKLHLSIDNLASGHAARAREAVVLYLDGILKREGGAAGEAQWRRIWAGYLSLNVAGFGLAGR